MKTKTVPAATLTAFAAALAAKRETAAAAAAAAAEAKRLAEEIGLPADSILLRDESRTMEIAALWNVRSVRAIEARTDTFHSFKITKDPTA
jgi:hypothetical protein